MRHYFSSLTESQVVNISSQPPNPVRVLEGQPLTLEWAFSVPNTVLRVQLHLQGSSIPLIEASPGSPNSIGKELRGRVNASSTETNARIIFFSVNRIDTANYNFLVIDTDWVSASAPLELIVQCKYKLYHSSLLFTERSKIVFGTLLETAYFYSERHQ